MLEQLEVLKDLYQKVKNGTATDLEKLRYKLIIETSCIREEVLLKMIETSTEEESLK